MKYRELDTGTLLIPEKEKDFALLECIAAWVGDCVWTGMEKEDDEISIRSAGDDCRAWPSHVVSWTHQVQLQRDDRGQSAKTSPEDADEEGWISADLRAELKLAPIRSEPTHTVPDPRSYDCAWRDDVRFLRLDHSRFSMESKKERTLDIAYGCLDLAS